MPTPVFKDSQPEVHNPNTRSITLSATKKRSGVVLARKSLTTKLPSLIAVEDMPNPARVTTEIAITKNMDNFESMKIGVFINSPCLNTDEQKLATHNHDLALAMKMLEKEAAMISQEWF